LFREQVKGEMEGATARRVFTGTDRLADDHVGSRYKWRD
jgi:hypothetical protein